MKTAMQELIEYYNRAIEIEESPMLEMQLRKYRMKAQLLLEKEKEQIIQAINAWCSDDNILTSEQYYNETYNQ